MQQQIDKLKHEVSSFEISNNKELENFRLVFLSKKGKISLLFEYFKKLPPEEKKITGQEINTLKNLAADRFEKHKKLIEASLSSVTQKQSVDYTLPANFSELGSKHPITIVRNKILNIFNNMGFVVEVGPEIEDDWHNFTALNFPPDHPARDMQDTFFINKSPDIALRTHTSTVQVRVMESRQPPIRSVFPGRVYRHEAISSRSHCFFHQIEGLYIDADVSFADLKQTLLHFAHELFDSQTNIRLRPSFFPFTEPSAEMDISCNLCNGAGCAFCKYSGWVEILGCGMVDPNVLENCNISSEKYTGFAFGLGIERITNLLLSVKDLRTFSENDIRFLRQFKATY